VHGSAHSSRSHLAGISRSRHTHLSRCECSLNNAFSSPRYAAPRPRRTASLIPLFPPPLPLPPLALALALAFFFLPFFPLPPVSQSLALSFFSGFPPSPRSPRTLPPPSLSLSLSLSLASACSNVTREGCISKDLRAEKRGTATWSRRTMASPISRRKSRTKASQRAAQFSRGLFLLAVRAQSILR